MQTPLFFLRFQVFLLKYHVQLLAGIFLLLFVILLSLISERVNLLGQVIPGITECNDGINIDPENDATFDYARDTGCINPADRREWKDGDCFDGKDNDGDGFIDRADFGCRTIFDGEKTPLARCQDTIDNDQDETIDMADRGCSSTMDNSEN